MISFAYAWGVYYLEHASGLNPLSWWRDARAGKNSLQGKMIINVMVKKVELFSTGNLISRICQCIFASKNSLGR